MEEPQRLSPKNDANDTQDIPEASGSRPRRNVRLPQRFGDMEVNSREFGPGLPHLPSYKSQKEQREEEEAEEADRKSVV